MLFGLDWRHVRWQPLALFNLDHWHQRLWLYDSCLRTHTHTDTLGNTDSFLSVRAMNVVIKEMEKRQWAMTHSSNFGSKFLLILFKWSIFPIKKTPEHSRPIVFLNHHNNVYSSEVFIRLKWDRRWSFLPALILHNRLQQREFFCIPGG